jgi:ADP-heptose:LPS heptosyltransferase
MTIPVLRVFSATYPHVKITVVSKAFHKPLFEEFPDVTFFPAEIKTKHKGINGILKLAKELKKEGVTAIADLHNVLRSKILVTYFQFENIPTAQIDKGRSEKRALTQKKNKKFKQLPTTFERYATVFKKLGFPIDLAQHQFPKRKEIPPKLLPIVDKTYKNHIGIAPFAAFEGKMYPLEMMEQVISMLDAEKQTQIFLFGGGTMEIEQLNVLAEKYASVVNMAGTLTFKEELSLIANLDAMLAMDSGNAHLAAIYGVPTVTIWGVTHPYAGFCPFQQPSENALMANREEFPSIPTSIYGNKFPAGYEKAITTISPQQILEKIIKIL